MVCFLKSEVKMQTYVATSILMAQLLCWYIPLRELAHHGILFVSKAIHNAMFIEKHFFNSSNKLRANI